MEAVRSAFIAGIAICGLAVFVLSLLPWLTFEARDFDGTIVPPIPIVSESFSGLDISRSRDIEDHAETEAPHEVGWCSCDAAIGDGYFTAALGLLIIASAGIARLGGRPALGGGAAALAGLAIVTIAGYNAIADWNAIIWTSHPVVTEGTVQVALYALIAVGAIAAFDGSSLWAISRAPEPTDEEAYDYDEDDEPTEGTEAWA
ncbi:MAG: hypothetical protein J4O12_05695 [Chloroflexi bacterium]|nr:hypothetical protein [Chloroflexota bacterium]